MVVPPLCGDVPRRQEALTASAPTERVGTGVPVEPALEPVRVLFTSVTPRDRAEVNRIMPRVGVAPGPLSADLVARYPDVEVVCCMVHDRVTEDLLASWPSLRAVVTRSTGFDHLPVEALARRGVTSYYLGGYAVAPVAELALMSLIALLRRVPQAMARTGGRDSVSSVPEWRRDDLVGRDLSDVVVGVVGTGRIGSAVVRRLVALGAVVRAFDPVRDTALEGLPAFAYVDSLGELLDASDALTLHVPLVDDGPHPTVRMLDGPALERLGPGAVLVNTARGGIVDLDAVITALDAGQLVGYACDVLEGEPSPPDLERLRCRTDVLVTPHLGAHSDGAIRTRYQRTAEIVAAVLAGNEGVVAAYRVG